MIKELTEINIINSFLKEFDTSMTNLDDPFKKYIGYEIDNKVVSFLNYSLIYDRIEIEYIYTNPDYRNKNLATILLNYLYDLGRSNNCSNITLEVRCSNLSVINFYEKNGFKKVSIRKKYYNGEDGILMIRELV